MLHKSILQPYFPLVAHKRFTPEQVRSMQAELAKLPDSDVGKEVLTTIGIKAFDTQAGERMVPLLKWLEG